MKVLLYDTTCGFLTPGGKTTHALMLKSEILKLGVDIQFACWWDQSQSDFDLIHFLTPDPEKSMLAKKTGKKTFLSLIFDFETNKTYIQQSKKILENRLIDLLPNSFNKNYYWKSFDYIDQIHFMHESDRLTAMKYFPQIEFKNTVIIPHAFNPDKINISNDDEFIKFNFPDKYLVSCANISERKQSIRLAHYAKIAKVPVVFIGSSIKSSRYFQLFLKEIDNQFVFYPGYVSEELKDAIERNASGFVLLSKGESGCIAVYEAAAYKLPLLLNNLPWAKDYEEPRDIYFCDANNREMAINQLKMFFNQASKLDNTPFTIRPWEEIAKMYVEQYIKILNK